MSAENPYAAPAPVLRRSLPGMGWAFAVGAVVGFAVMAYVAVDICREIPRNPTGEFIADEAGWNLRNLGWGILCGLPAGLFLGSLATGIAACVWVVGDRITTGWRRVQTRRSP